MLLDFTFARNLLRTRREARGFVFSRPLVAIHSDDWGRVGVRDQEGHDSLRDKGINLGEDIYDYYSLETAEDVTALASLLSRHRDSIGRSPCITTNFCTANLDFRKMKANGFRRIELFPLAQGLPGSWSRPGLFEAYRQGIEEGVFYPAMHSLTHFCPVAIENALAKDSERSELLRKFWESETPYIYWRMPWIGYEYWNPERPGMGFLSAELQDVQVRKAVGCFAALFGKPPVSACAPGYFANRDTRRSWSKAGILIAQNGCGGAVSAPYIDSRGTLQLHRTIDLEPSHQKLDVDDCLRICSDYFSRGLPVIISTHSINFHSTLKDFRSNTLAVLDHLLTALAAKHPELLYVHDEDLYRIVTEGVFHSRNERVTVSAKQEWTPRMAHQGAM